MSSHRASADTSVPTLDRYLTYRLHMLHKLSDKASQELYQSVGDLSLSVARCLASVGSFPQLTVNNLAHEANLDKGQASRAAQALADRGLLCKTTRASDGRSVSLTLTDAGQARWQAVMALIDRRNQEIFGCLSPGEQLLLGEMFDRLIAHAKAQQQQRCDG